MSAATGSEQHKPVPADPLSGFLIRYVLSLFRSFDLNYKSGKVYAYVYPASTRVSKIAKEAYMQFLTENGLDFTVFPSLLRLETEVVSMVLAHLNAPLGAVGSFTTGGTESIFLASKAARDFARSKGIDKPQMIAPITAHAAFHKACHLLNIELVSVPVDPITRRVTLEAMRKAITTNTVMIVGSVTSYAHGTADPIAALGQLAEEHGLWLHVDGCIGGWLLPYWRKLGVPTEQFDFADVPGVSSISVDLHKYGYTPKPASTVLYRTAALREFQLFTCSSWPGYTIVNTTFQSSKSGGPVAAAWATMHAIGESGYLQIMGDILHGTRQLTAGIKALGPDLVLVAEPDANLICFAAGHPDLNVFHLCDLMKQRGWYLQSQLSFQDSPRNVHISVNPEAARLAPFLLADLAACIPAAKLYLVPTYVLNAIALVKDQDSISHEQYNLLLSSMGLSTTAPPKSMAAIHTTLEALTPALRNHLLCRFVNDAFQFDNVVAEAESKAMVAAQIARIKRGAVWAGCALAGFLAVSTWVLRSWRAGRV